VILRTSPYRRCVAINCIGYEWLDQWFLAYVDPRLPKNLLIGTLTPTVNILTLLCEKIVWKKFLCYCAIAAEQIGHINNGWIGSGNGDVGVRKDKYFLRSVAKLPQWSPYFWHIWGPRNTLVERTVLRYWIMQSPRPNKASFSRKNPLNQWLVDHVPSGRAVVTTLYFIALATPSWPPKSQSKPRLGHDPEISTAGLGIVGGVWVVFLLSSKCCWFRFFVRCSLAS